MNELIEFQGFSKFLYKPKPTFEYFSNNLFYKKDPNFMMLCSILLWSSIKTKHSFEYDLRGQKAADTIILRFKLNSNHKLSKDFITLQKDFIGLIHYVMEEILYLENSQLKLLNGW
jgi:hypothetical protein